MGKPRPAKALLLILALLPLLLFAYMVQFDRLINDDYVHLAVGRELGPWGAMLYWRSVWNGSYVDHIVFSLMSPFGADAPRVFSTTLFGIWLLSTAWLFERLLARLRVERHRYAMALGGAALTLAATINAFYTPQSLYYLAAIVRYNLPLPLLALYLALLLAATSRGYRGPSLQIVAAAGFVICFVAAGLSELYMVFQLCLLSTLLALAALYARRGGRKVYLALMASGWAATILSLLMQITAPGIVLRSTQFSPEEMMSKRALPDFAHYLAEGLVRFVLREETIAGFFLLFAIGLFAALCLQRSPGAALLSRPVKFARASLWCGLIVQLAFAPILWAHTSDQLSVLGRFSYAYSSVIVLNLGLLFAFLFLLWRGRGIGKLLLESRNKLMVLSAAVLLLALGLFIAIHWRSIHHRASHYLMVTFLLLIGILAWQLEAALGDEQSRRYGLALILMTLTTALSSVVLVSVPLYTIGRVTARVTTPAILMQVALGLLWGAYVGILLRRAGQWAPEAWRRRLGLSGLAVAIVIGAGIMLGQATFIPDLQTFAQQWDEREKLIISQRDRGEQNIVVAPLSFDLSWHILYTRMSRPMESGSAAKYYGVESIRVDTDNP